MTKQIALAFALAAGLATAAVAEDAAPDTVRALITAGQNQSMSGSGSFIGSRNVRRQVQGAGAQSLRRTPNTTS